MDWLIRLVFFLLLLTVTTLAVWFIGHDELHLTFTKSLDITLIGYLIFSFNEGMNELRDS